MLVGLDEADDAAVVRMDGGRAIVATVDFFTPVVDDAYDWGRIACANAVSDVYAMGGTPLVGLNVAGWPRGELPLSLLAEVLRGGADVAREAGMVIVGGHTVDDPEPKYGLCVIGHVDADRMMTMSAAKRGDTLVLTKPIGTGIVSTALKRDGAMPEQVAAAVASMVALNDDASRRAVAAGVRAATDVTGFGLLGHLHRLARASGVAAEIEPAAVPLLPGARDLAAAGFVPGGTGRNRSAVEPHVDWSGADDVTRTLLCDAQTSGGLLVCLPGGARMEGAVVGRIVDGPPGTIRLRG